MWEKRVGEQTKDEQAPNIRLWLKIKAENQVGQKG